MSIKILGSVDKLVSNDERVIQLSGDTDGVIASFYDKDNNPSLFMDGTSARLGNVGIKTATPNEALTVTGNISATGFLHQHANFCVLALTANQTLTVNTDTILNLVVKDDPNSWYYSTNHSVKPTVAGYYNVIGMVNYKEVSNSNNQQNIQLLKNSNTFSLAMTPNNTTIPLTLVAQGIVYCNGSTDEIKLQAYSSHNNGHTINGTSDGAWTKLEVFKIS